MSKKSELAVAIRYALARWTALTRYRDDGGIEIDKNIAEHSLRAVALGRNNYLFAGPDAGGERAAAFYSLIGDGLAQRARFRRLPAQCLSASPSIRSTASTNCCHGVSQATRHGTTPSRVEAPEFDTGAAELSYIAMLIDDGWQITLGALHPIPCVAVTNDNHGSLAMLRCRPGESIPKLLHRLNDSIALAVEADEMIDEINVRESTRKR